MIVYIVIGGWNYEGFKNLEVHTNKDKAIKRVEEIYKERRYDYVEIEEHEVID